MKICPNCGAENEDNALTCILCEFDFDAEENSSDEYDNNVIDESSNSENAAVSYATNDRIDYENANDSHSDNTVSPVGNNNVKIIALISIIVIAGGIIGGIFLMKGKGTSKSGSSDVSESNISMQDQVDPNSAETAASSEDTSEIITTSITDTKTASETTTSVVTDPQQLYKDKIIASVDNEDYSGKDSHIENATADMVFYDIDGTLNRIELPNVTLYSGPAETFEKIDSSGYNEFFVVGENSNWYYLMYYTGAGRFAHPTYGYASKNTSSQNVSLSSTELGKIYNLYYFNQLCASDCQGYFEDIDGDGIEELIRWGYGGGYVVFSYANDVLADNILKFPGESQMKTPLLSGYELLNKCKDKAAEHGFGYNRNFVYDNSAMLGYVNTQGGTLNLRDEPSTNSRVITEIPYGTFFNVYNQVDENGNRVLYYNGGWYYITVTVNNTSYSGWISADYAYVTDPSI